MDSSWENISRDIIETIKNATNNFDIEKEEMNFNTLSQIMSDCNSKYFQGYNPNYMGLYILSEIYKRVFENAFEIFNEDKLMEFLDTIKKKNQLNFDKAFINFYEQNGGYVPYSPQVVERLYEVLKEREDGEI